MIIRSLISGLSWLVFALFVSAQSPGADSESESVEQTSVDALRAFHRASELFESGQFEAARDAFLESEAAGGDSPALYFNLGTTFLRLGDNGRALHRLLLAQQGAPRDEDVEVNLAVARTRLGHADPRESRSFLSRILNALSDRTTPREHFVLFVAVQVLFLALWAMRIFWGRPRSRGLLVVVASLAVLLAATLAWRQFGTEDQAIGIVLDDATAFTGPSETAHQPHFKLLRGDRVEILEERRGWLKVRAGEKELQGYLPAPSLGLVGAP